MIVWHGLALYVACGVAFARIVNRWTRLTLDNLLVPVLLWPLLVLYWLIAWPYRRRETLDDYGGRAAAERLLKDLKD